MIESGINSLNFRIKEKHGMIDWIEIKDFILQEIRRGLVRK